MGSRLPRYCTGHALGKFSHFRPGSHADFYMLSLWREFALFGMPTTRLLSTLIEIRTPKTPCSFLVYKSCKFHCDRRNGLFCTSRTGHHAGLRPQTDAPTSNGNIDDDQWLWAHLPSLDRTYFICSPAEGIVWYDIFCHFAPDWARVFRKEWECRAAAFKLWSISVPMFYSPNRSTPFSV